MKADTRTHIVSIGNGGAKWTHMASTYCTKFVFFSFFFSLCMPTFFVCFGELCFVSKIIVFFFRAGYGRWRRGKINGASDKINYCDVFLRGELWMFDIFVVKVWHRWGNGNQQLHIYYIVLLNKTSCPL